ncbi:MAG: porin [Rhizomicrobium sp.]|jgi:phosphate-selective porin OprO/OprP
MQTVSKTFAAALLAGAASLALASSALAAGKYNSDGTSAAQSASSDNNAKIQALENEIQDLSNQVQDLKRSTSDQYTDVQNQQTAAVKVTIANGRPTISSADGNFTAAIRTLAQADWGYYSQGAAAKSLPAAYGPDLSSGANFRRVYLGIQGKLFGDWSYNFNYDFGGSGGTETPGHIQSVYLQYDGWAPWAFRVGAYPPPANIEDGTSSSDTIFLERNSPSDLQRNIAGGDGRDAVTILYAGDTVFGAASFTGNKIQDGAKALAAAGATAVPNYDEQLGVLGRLSYLPISTADAHWLIGVNGTYVIKPPDAVANGTATLATTPGATAKNSVTLSDPPELTVDSNGTLLATTGSLPANHISQWGVETAGNFENFYGQAGYYDFQVDRAPVAYKTYTSASATATTIVQPSGNNFSAWYVQASWILTGESKGYNAANGAFTPPKPAQPFSLTDGGWGAWELAARYSDLNLNDHVYDTANVVTNWTGASTKTYTYYNTVRGGDQKIATVGLNWYPNNALRFALDYQWIDASRLQAPAAVTTTGTPTLPTVNGGQTVQAIALRAQVSF